MKKLILVLLFVPLISFGQTKEGMELCIAFQTKSFYSNKEADNALEKILSVTGLKKNFTLTPCDGINNALAISLKGERYILYDKNFMRAIGGSSSNLAILAHEIGHHLNNHARDITLYIGGVIEPDSKQVSRRQELEADEFAGFVMARLGYSLEETKQPFYKLSNNNDDSYSTHPSRDKRLNAITEGYMRAGGNSRKDNSYVEKNTSITMEKINSIFNQEIDNGKTELEYLEEQYSIELEKVAEEFRNLAKSYQDDAPYQTDIVNRKRQSELEEMQDNIEKYTLMAREDLQTRSNNLNEYYKFTIDYIKIYEKDSAYRSYKDCNNNGIVTLKEFSNNCN